MLCGCPPPAIYLGGPLDCGVGGSSACETPEHLDLATLRSPHIPENQGTVHRHSPPEVAVGRQRLAGGWQWAGGDCLLREVMEKWERYAFAFLQWLWN